MYRISKELFRNFGIFYRKLEFLRGNDILKSMGLLKNWKYINYK